jgi:hypothetical protein
LERQLQLPLRRADGLTQGQRRKEAGLQRVEARGRHWLREARNHAVYHCNKHGSVAADDVLLHLPIPEGISPNTAGALFNDKRFEPTGRWRPSKRPESHARQIQEWKLTTQEAK